MTYRAAVVEVMLASPGDVKEERVIARKVMSQWNAEHSREAKIVLLTMGWETHAGSDVSGKRAQAQINERLVENADLMVGIFWTRLGTPTGRSPSGTVEEIKRHYAARKPLMLFFSNEKAPPSDIDMAQYSKVKRFREWAESKGLIATFTTEEEFADTFRQHLNLMLQSNDRMRALIMSKSDGAGATGVTLSADAQGLLHKISNGANGQISVQFKDGKMHFLSGGASILDAENTLSILKWRAALDELLAQGIVADKTGRNQVFELGPKAAGHLAPTSR